MKMGFLSIISSLIRMSSLKMVKLMAMVNISKEELMMKSKLLIRLGAPVLALSLVTACGMGNDDQDPVNEEAPLNEEGDMNEMDPAQEENTDQQDGMMEDGNQNEAPNDNLRDEDR